jgi:chromosome segregation ATPase
MERAGGSPPAPLDAASKSVALTPAQKQKAYRDRLKKRLQDKDRRLAELEGKADGRAAAPRGTETDAAADALAQELAQAKAHIRKLEAELARERTRRTRVYGEVHHRSLDWHRDE